MIEIVMIKWKILITRPKPARPRLDTRVSQKKQKSEFCFATNPTGFHRLDEPPDYIWHIWPYLAYLGAYLKLKMACRMAFLGL